MPAFAPFVDPFVDALTRESRNSTLLLRVASEATLTLNAAWSEYLTRRAVQFDPANPDAVLKLARVLRTLERNEEALGWFVSYAGWCRATTWRWRTSAAASARSAATRPRTSPARSPASTTRPPLQPGLLMATTGRPGPGERRRAIAIDPAHADARATSPAARALGRPAEAVRLRQLVADDPENVAALTNLGSC